MLRGVSAGAIKKYHPDRTVERKRNASYRHSEHGYEKEKFKNRFTRRGRTVVNKKTVCYLAVHENYNPDYFEAHKRRAEKPDPKLFAPLKSERKNEFRREYFKRHNDNVENGSKH